MATVHVEHTIGRLQGAMLRAATGAKPGLARIAKRGVKDGELATRRIAQAASGPHGTNYHKRVSSEMLSPLSGEWGPHGDVVANAVGGGWRHGSNTDLEKSIDLVLPKVAKEVGDMAGRLFW